MHRFNARPDVDLLYRKPLGDITYKQWELVGSNSCLSRDRNLGNWKGGAKSRGRKVGIGRVREEVWELLCFVALVCVWVHFHCYSGGCLYQGLEGLWVCMVGRLG
jgi:hypothetical protein